MLGGEHAGSRRVGMVMSHVKRVLPQDGGFHTLRADQMVRYEQESAALDPSFVPRQYRRQLRNGTGMSVLCQQQIQNSHKVALAGAEAAMQIGSPTAAVESRILDQIQ